MGLKPWDICAGILIAQEAGVIVTDLAGQHTMLDSGNIVAANTYLHSILLQQIAAA